MKRWTLRTKLTAWSALMVGVVLIVCGAGAVLFMQYEQIEVLDDQLANEAHTFFGTVDRVGTTLDWTQRAEVKAILPLTRTERFVEITGADGRSLYRSKEPKRADLPRLGPGTHTIKIGKDNARLGIFPSLAPLVYLNDPRTKTIVIDRRKAPLVRKAFELYAKNESRLEDVANFLFQNGIKTGVFDQVAEVRVKILAVAVR